jgi:hypothetical protein
MGVGYGQEDSHDSVPTGLLLVNHDGFSGRFDEGVEDVGLESET